MKYALSLSAALMLCACLPAQDVSIPGNKTCGAERIAPFVGQSVDLVELPTDHPYRVLPPDSIVTMDYLPERLNIFVTKDNVITELTCG